VLVAGRTQDKVAQVVRAIDAAGGSAAAVPIDATREADVVRLFDQAGDALDLVVVFNAGNKPARRFSAR
jgi:NAD(P)-dependent dehydrogenase (short-subunit alcohol dehydrogenase family)